MHSRSAGRWRGPTCSSARIYGRTPNWGRILASVGTTSAAFDPADLDVALNGVWVCRTSGLGEDPRPSFDLDARDRLGRDRPEVRARGGDDLDQRPDARLRARELGVRVMSPRDLTSALAKAATLTEALPWLERFHGKRRLSSSTAATRWSTTT